MSSLIARVRAEDPRTIVLDGGDTLQGTALTHYVLEDPHTELVDPTIATMNLAGYDAAVLGNHEFNYGLAPLRRALSQSRFPWLAANLDGVDAAGLAVGDTLLLDKGGVRVAILGLTNPNVPNWELQERRPGLTFNVPLAEAERRVPALRSVADVVIVVAHTGFERDLDDGGEDRSTDENFGWRLAQVPGIDLLLGGTYQRDPVAKAQGWITAADATTGAIKWRHQSPRPIVAAVTTTAGNVLFAGELTGDFVTLDARSGDVLYRFNPGGPMGGGVVTYEAGGRQYVAAASGSPSNFWVDRNPGSPTVVVFALAPPVSSR